MTFEKALREVFKNPGLGMQSEWWANDYLFFNKNMTLKYWCVASGRATPARWVLYYEEGWRTVPRIDTLSKMKKITFTKKVKKTGRQLMVKQRV